MKQATWLNAAAFYLHFLIAVYPAIATSDDRRDDKSYRAVSKIETRGAPLSQALAVHERARRLFSAREGAVDVYDLESGERIGSVAFKGMPGGLALAPDLNRGFVTAQGDGTLKIFDLDSLAAVVETKSARRAPGEITYDAADQRIYVSHADGMLVAFDANTGKRMGALSLGGKLRQAVADGRGNLFVADEAAHALHVVDAKALASLGVISVWPCKGPTALVNDTKERRIYVACSNGRMIVVDPDPGQMIASVQTTGKGAAGMAMQVGRARLVRLFMPAVDGTLDIVENAKLTATLERSVQVGSQGTAVAIDDQTDRAYFAADGAIIGVER